MEIGQVKIFYHLPTCIVKYVSKYIFFVSKNTYKQRAKENKDGKRKTKETKEEKERENVVAANGGKSNKIQ